MCWSKHTIKLSLICLYVKKKKSVLTIVVFSIKCTNPKAVLSITQQVDCQDVGEENVQREL